MLNGSLAECVVIWDDFVKRLQNTRTLWIFHAPLAWRLLDGAGRDYCKLLHEYKTCTSIVAC